MRVIFRVVKPRIETLAPPLAGFPGENLFEPNAGAAGGTSATNPFEYVLRCCGPKCACARVSLGKGESDVRSIEETFRRNPVGREPTR